MGTRQKEVLVAELERSASHGWMKSLKIHTKSALFGAGLVVLVGVLSAQTIHNRFVSVRVLETPVIKTEADWPPHPKDIFYGSFSVTNATCGQWEDVYTVPNDKWLVVQAYAYEQFGYFRPGDSTYTKMDPVFQTQNFTNLLTSGGFPLPPGTRVAIYPNGGNCAFDVRVYGYLVDA